MTAHFHGSGRFHVGEVAPLCLGAAVCGPEDAARLLMIDAFGEIWLAADGSRPELVRWCLAHGVYCFSELGLLVEALLAGRCHGLLPHIAMQLARPLSAFDGVDLRPDF